MATETVIVVVEDDANIADLVELYLRRDGFRVYQASDGETALKTVPAWRMRPFQLSPSSTTSASMACGMSEVSVGGNRSAIALATRGRLSTR